MPPATACPRRLGQFGGKRAARSHPDGGEQRRFRRQAGAHPGPSAPGRAHVHPHLERGNRVGTGGAGPWQHRPYRPGPPGCPADGRGGHPHLDLSHASPELFWDVAEMAHKPLVASHSNAKEVCAHPRNLEKASSRPSAILAGWWGSISTKHF